ncbi:MAG: NYN domain-containing protein [Streptosporangiaceae bacterium]
MPTAALLIDWENLKFALLEGNYRFTTADLARGLRDSAAALAKSVNQDLRLDHAIAFAPARALDNQTTQALRANDVTPYVTHGGRQAADLTIAIRATQLRYEVPSTDFFVVVTGDGDFLPLVEELNKGGSRCHIWGAEKDLTSRSIQPHPLAGYVAPMLNLRRDDPERIGAEQQLVFLLMCHRILDRGIHLGSPSFACQRLAELNIWDLQRVEQMWNVASGRHVIDHLRGFDQDGKPGTTRRLAYERETQVMRPVWVADLAVQRAAVSRRRGPMGRGELISLLEQCGVPEADRAGFLKALEVSGYLAPSGNGYVAADSSGRYGLIGAAMRVALAYYAVTAGGRQESLGLGQLIKNHWPRFYKPGGDLTTAESVQSAEDARQSVERAIAIRMAARTKAVLKDGRKVQAITVLADHPVTVFLRKRLHLAVTELTAAGAKATVPYDVFAARMAALPVGPWASAEADSWLSLLAAERVVTWKNREITLNNTPLGKEIVGWAE